MKESKMWKIRMSSGYRKKRCEYANFLFHACSSSDRIDKRFKGFDACGELFQVKVSWEYPPTNKNTLIRALTKDWDNCLNSCWIMLCKAGHNVWNVASHSIVGCFRS
ncbi:hypothetical protein AVEN_82206-1 [Araneus ventricosus]|uniref:Uncharacterized protein n=1 Tax=Araneus ventricosus TaxID=182803 RepID=A0A4Y2KEY8_ARAVE|nr:hypothetical protein AVEN_24663-1 [Araneus ventricosus]GBN00903.1 hypothetical protein AVEN_82206-1 [Araneus ventricosus]